MVFARFRRIAEKSQVALHEQYKALTGQIPLMYALMFINVFCLAMVTYGDVPVWLSLSVPATLSVIIVVRGFLWMARKRSVPSPSKMRRHLAGTIVMSAVLSAAFGAWGLFLLNEVATDRITSVALYVFVGSISCCYCLQSLPVAGRFVLLFGAAPVTLCLLTSSDVYLIGIGVTFLIIAAVIVRTLATSQSAFSKLLISRSEMSALVAALRQSEDHYRYSVDLNPQMPWISDAAGAILELSPKWEAVTGMPTADALGSGWTGAVHPADLPPVLDLWHRTTSAPDASAVDVRYRLRDRSGVYRWHRARAQPRRGEDGTILKWYGTLEDIDDQVKAENALRESEERYRLASRATNDIIWDCSLEQDRIDWSEAAFDVLGYAETRTGTSRSWWVDHIHADDQKRVVDNLASLEDMHFNQWVEQFRFRAADGRYLNLVARGYVVRNKDGKPIRLLGSLHDVTAQLQYEAKLKWSASHDALTGLPNRAMFAERLDEALDDARRQGQCVGLIVLDVDRFKTINDTLGHHAGDAVLHDVAAKLSKRLPVGATLARLGGDEFAIILPGLTPEQARQETVDTIMGSLTGSLLHDGRHIDVSLSAGGALAFRDGLDAEELHKCADLALYAAKSEGPGQIRGFTPAMREAVDMEKAMLTKARAALTNDHIIPFYQPKVNLRTGALEGFEALLRIHDQQQGLQPPGAIRAAFEDADLAVRLTDRMLDCIMADMVAWRDQGLAFGRIAFNGAPGDFRRGDFVDRILGRMHKLGLPASLLELEVTETVFVGQLSDRVHNCLETLAAAGVTIALDDFGTGYASLTHLQQFPVHTIKIDRSFVSRLNAAETGDAAIVGAVIDLAKNLGITTVAEGIETAAQAAHLMVKGCDVGQGFLFGRPMARSQIAPILAKWDAPGMIGLCAGSDWADMLRSSMGMHNSGPLSFSESGR
tara:strand:- start:2065 stop:4872 length:2808 start_codon:yes stop_codon:yes gene_type:complete